MSFFFPLVLTFLNFRKQVQIFPNRSQKEKPHYKFTFKKRYLFLPKNLVCAKQLLDNQKKKPYWLQNNNCRNYLMNA